MVETKDMVEKTNNQNLYLKRRIEEVEFILHKSHKGNFLFQDIEKRLSTLENKVANSISLNSTQFEQIKFHNQLFGERLQILEGQNVVCLK
jgi:ABC-type hemin transport system substrate-binding protein